MDRIKKQGVSFTKNSTIFLCLILFATFFLGIGYAQISDIDLTISGEATAKAQTGIVISDITYASNNNANSTSSKINTYYQTMMSSEIVLGNSLDSSITYTVSIVNLTSDDYVFENVIYDELFYDNQDITFELSNLSPNDFLYSGATITFQITFKYRDDLENLSNNTLNSTLNFKFKKNQVTTALFDTGRNVNAKMKKLAGNSSADFNSSNNNIKKIIYSDNIPEEYKNSEHLVSASSSETPIYMWFDTDTIYYGSDADEIYLNSVSSYMFQRLTSLEQLDTNFKTDNTTTFEQFLWEDGKLPSIDVSHFNTSNAINMKAMFSQCQSLIVLDLSSFDTEKVMYMDNMFNNANSLTSLDVSNFNTSSLKSMNRMFASLKSLPELDVSSFDTSNVTNMSYSFDNMYVLKTIYASEKFVTTRVTEGQQMFINDRELIGGNGTTYDSAHIDYHYAVIDTADTPGYFTKK